MMSRSFSETVDVRNELMVRDLDNRKRMNRSMVTSFSDFK